MNIWIVFHVGFLVVSSFFIVVECSCIWSSSDTLDCYIKASCSSAGITVTVKGTDFPKSASSAVFLNRIDDTSVPTGCGIDVSSAALGSSNTATFAIGTTACVDDGTTNWQVAGDMETTIYLKYDGVGNVTTEDIQADIKCLVTFPSSTPVEASIKFPPSVVQVKDNYDHTIPWTGTSLKFYDAANPNTELNSLTLNANTTQICAKITTTDTGIEDFNIKTLKFSATLTNHVAGQYIDVIDVGCTNVGYDGMFEYPSMSASSGTCTSILKEQCLKQRVVCFEPFGFQNKNSLYVIATLKRLQTGTFATAIAPGNLETCGSGVGVGRKRRNTLENEEDVKISGVLKVFQNDDHLKTTVYMTVPCDQKYYVIAITAMSGVVLGLLVFMVYMLVIITKKSKHSE